MMWYRYLSRRMMMGLGFIWMLLFWGGLILLAIWLISLLFPAISLLMLAYTNRFLTLATITIHV